MSIHTHSLSHKCIHTACVCTYTPRHTHMHTRLSVSRVSDGAQTTTNMQFLLMDPGLSPCRCCLGHTAYSASCLQCHPSFTSPWLPSAPPCLPVSSYLQQSSRIFEVPPQTWHRPKYLPDYHMVLIPPALVPSHSSSAQCLHIEQMDTYFCILEVWREEVMNLTQTSPASHSSCSCV